MRRVSLILLLSLLLSALAPVASAYDDYATSYGTTSTSSATGPSRLIFLPIGKQQVLVNGAAVQLDVPAVILNDRTMVPVRFISETIGADVAWDGTERRVTISMGDRKVEIWVDRREARVNGQTLMLDAEPRIMNDRTVVPLRFVSENLGLTVGWDPKERGVYLVSGPVAGVVLIRSHGFETPARAPIEVKVGEPVVVINLDTVPHTLTDYSFKFDSGNLQTGWATVITVKEPGTYTIFCDWHPGMDGRLVAK